MSRTRFPSSLEQLLTENNILILSDVYVGCFFVLCVKRQKRVPNGWIGMIALNMVSNVSLFHFSKKKSKKKK